MPDQPAPHVEVSPAWRAVLNHAAVRAARTEVFGALTIEGPRLQAAAKASGSPAWYRLELTGGKPWVGLVTPDRYLSQSIEQDLVHTGDKMPELLEEELIELGYSDLIPGPPRLPVEHFRDEAKLFTFRTPLPAVTIEPGEIGQEAAAIVLLAYEAMFRRLGAMEEGED